MDDSLGPLIATRKTGEEPFRSGSLALDFKLLEFWQWMGSDLIGNTFRGAVAEYLVARALGIADGVRDEWGAFDLRTREGLKIEVKSCAYLQSWRQRGPSAIVFGVRPTRAWDPETGLFATDVRRQADVYVFALLRHRAKASLDPLDVEQWEFFVLSTKTLDARLPSGCRQLGLRGLMELEPTRASFHELAEALSTFRSPAIPAP